MEMGLEVAIILFIFFSLVTVLWLRNLISGLISYRLNRSARKKRKKGESFLDKVFFKRYRDVVPHGLILWYVSLMVVPFIVVLITLFIRLFCEESICLIILLVVDLSEYISVGIFELLASKRWSTFYNDYKMFKKHKRYKE